MLVWGGLLFLVRGFMENLVCLFSVRVGFEFVINVDFIFINFLVIFGNFEFFLFMFVFVIFDVFFLCVFFVYMLYIFNS